MAGRPRKTAVTKDEKVPATSASQKASEEKTEEKAKQVTEAGGADMPSEAEAKKAEPKKPGRKPAAKKLEEAGTAVKAAAEKVEKTAKNAAAKAEKKASETARKVTAAAKKAMAADTYIVVQHAGREISPKQLLDNAKAAWLAKGNKESEFKSIELYINVDENRYYPVINGEEQGGFEI